LQRNNSLGLRLALLVAGTTLPLILFAAGVMYVDHVHEREAAFDNVLQTVRTIRLTLDRDIQALTAGLQVLALSPAAQNGDVAAFRNEAEAYQRQFPHTPVISLADRDGHQLLNSRLPPGIELPPRANKDTVDVVFATGRPAYSKLFIGNVSRELLVTVQVPVIRDGVVVYDLASTVSISTFQEMLAAQRPSDQWTVAFFDSAGTIFARLPNPEQTVGRSPSRSLLAEMFKHPEAKVVTTTLEGTELITAYTRSPLTGWTVAGGIPTALITVPLWRNLAIAGVIGLALLAIGLFFAVQMASRIAHGEALHELLINELNHRVKNTLASVQSIAAVTLRQTSDPKEAIAKFNDRLNALGRAHNVLSDQKWESVEVRDLVERVTAPYATGPGGRITMEGPELRVAPRCALLVSMALHELATNAAKYGALSTAAGRVAVNWDRIDAETPSLSLQWRETGGPLVQQGTSKGFGSRLIEESFASQISGGAKLELKPDGAVCTLECPLA
jgi:two-component sensor histidine kinase